MAKPGDMQQHIKPSAMTVVPYGLRVGCKVEIRKMKVEMPTGAGQWEELETSLEAWTWS